MSWTDERIVELTRLWEQGLTTGEIGKALGVSKNAVVGKAHRLGLAGRPSPIKRLPDGTPIIAAPAAVAPRKVAEPVSRHVEAAAKDDDDGAERVMSVVDLSAMACRWPHGDPGTKDFHFCGKRVQPGKPYCPDHVAVAYVKSSPKKGANAA